MNIIPFTTRREWDVQKYQTNKIWIAHFRFYGHVFLLSLVLLN